MKKPKAKKEVFEREIGGDGCEFTVVCHPATDDPAPGEDIRKTQAPDLVCKIVDTKAQPTN